MDIANEAHPSDPSALSAPLILRGGYLVAGLLALRASSQLWEDGFLGTSSISLALHWALALLAFGLLALATLPASRSERFRLLVPVVYLLIFYVCAHEHVLGNRLEGFARNTDGRMFNDYAARLIRQGKNPYTHDLIDGFALHFGSLFANTPLENGDFSGRLAYPALSPLVFVPFQWAHVDGLWVYPTFFGVALVVLYVGAAKRWRPLVLAPLFIDGRFLDYTLIGVSDVAWALLLVLMVLAWQRPRARAIWFGLACAFKQQPALIAPFLLIRIWKETEGDAAARRRAIVRFAAIAAVTFLVVNLPWLVASPRAWAHGVLEPMLAPMITYSQGLSELTMLGLKNLPRWFYSSIVLLVYGLLVLVYARRFELLKPFAWLAPALALWFAWRGLSSYWYFWLIPFLAELAREDFAPSEAQQVPARGGWRFAVGGLALVPFVAAFAFPPSHTLTASVRYPLFGTDFHVFRMSIDVTNHTPAAIEPRFAIQSAAGQPFYWIIDDGPPRLEPHQTATYAIRSSILASAFESRRGARLIVNDALRPSNRAMVAIPGYRTLGAPGEIANGRFLVWGPPDLPDAPAGWHLGREWTLDWDRPVPSRDDRDQPAVRMRVRSHPGTPAGTRAAMWLATTSMAWDGPLEVKIRLPRDANRFPDPKYLYGLRLRGRPQSELMVLFGDQPATGMLGTRPYVVLPAPREQWTTQRLDVARLFADAHLPLVARDQVDPSMPSLDVPYVPLQIELFVEMLAGEPFFEGEFGALRWPGPARSLDERVADDERHPEIFLTWRGDGQREQNDLGRAEQSYREALRANPEHGPAHHQLAELLRRKGDLAGAIEHYERAIALGYSVGTSHRGLGWAQLSDNRPDEAIASFDLAIRAAPLHPLPEDRQWIADAFKGKGLALARLHRCKEAGDAFWNAKIRWAAVDVPESGCP